MKDVILLIIILISFSSVAQNKSIPFDKKSFKEEKDAFKIAADNLEQGDKFYAYGLDPAIGFSIWSEAIPFYKKANDFNPDNASLNYQLGNCYLVSIHKSSALDHFIHAYKLNPAIKKDIHYKIGRAYQYQYKFDKALYEYGLFRKTLNSDTDAEVIVELTRFIEQCKTGKTLMDFPERIWIDNLGKHINTEYPDYAPLISTDESVIMFTSRRSNSTGGEMTGAMYMEDLYISEKDKDGNWSPAVGISEQINTNGHDATAGLSLDGLSLFVYMDNGDKGNLYLSNKLEDGWEKPKGVGKNINNKKTRETGACFTSDKKSFYFVSDREETLGGTDIWRTNWDEEKEEWGEPVNIGDVINTSYDEVGVFIHPDGRTMYFSSKGHKGMGGFDIFYSIMNDDGTWNEPVNIGYPVSTPDDDVHFVISASGKHGYYSSFREEDGMGEKDIYMITFLGDKKEPLLSAEDNLLASVAAPIKEELIQPKVLVSAKNLSILKGLVLDAETKKPVKSFIDLVDNGTQEHISEFNNDPVTGKFLMSLPAGKNYGIAAKAEGYLFHSENFDIPADAGFKEYEKVIYLNKIKKGVSIVLRNIFFDTDKYSLKPESKIELDRLIQLLTDNLNLRIEISGHTDTHGSSSYNQRLSEDRAGAVVDYLVAHGFGRERFEFKGIGEAKPLVTDAEREKMKSNKDREDADGHNRRTEFMIID
jgi:outer membrane protein OmpA-like peptidoglycan-associated protein